MKKIIPVFIALFVITLSLKGQTHVFYGTAESLYGGTCLFKYDPVKDTGMQVYLFDSSQYFDNDYQSGPVMQANNGLLYGMMYRGGLFGGGFLYNFNTATNRENVLLHFNKTTGMHPYGGLLQVSDSMLYGMTSQGGKSNDGVIFRYNIYTGQYVILFNFDSATNGAQPTGTLMQATNGLLYGCTNTGGPGVGNGVFFSFNIHTLTYRIIASALANPFFGSVIQATNGFIYGTTASGGSRAYGRIFCYDPIADTFATVYSFYGFLYADSAAAPMGPLIQAPNGLMYGMTEFGGINSNGMAYCFNPKTNTCAPAVDGRGSEGGFALDSANGLLYGITHYGKVLECNPNTRKGKLADSMLRFTASYYLLYAIEYNPSESSDSLSGYVYVDSNYDCQYDAGDSPIPNIAVKAVYKGNVVGIATTNALGQYTFYNMFPHDTFDIEIDSSVVLGYKVACPLKGYITDTTNSFNNNLALECNGGFDLASKLAVCNWKPYHVVSIEACIQNNRCQPVNSTMKVVIDTSMHMYSYIADSTPVVSGDTLVWKYNHLNSYSKGDNCVELYLTVDSLPHLDSVPITLIAYPITGDSAPKNNVIKYWLKLDSIYCIGEPYDPNNKTVSPQGSIAYNQKLTYTINFQNTGTRTAINVVINDTLSPYLNPATLHVISNSAPVTTKMLSATVVQFTFSKINLPDSSHGKAASSGDIVYSIMPMTNVGKGNTILNWAGIYFDSLPPIITDTTINIINNNTNPTEIATTTETIKDAITCFPNPGSGVFTLQSSAVSGKYSVEVYNVLGEEVYSQFAMVHFPLSINLSNQPGGIYLYRVITETGALLGEGKLIIQH